MSSNEITDKQPFLEVLKSSLPANFFLFTKVESESKSIKKNVKSSFHNTPEHTIFYFYKSISNIL